MANIIKRATNYVGSKYRSLFIRPSLGRPTWSGGVADTAMLVTPDTAQNYSAVWQAIQVRSQFFKALPFTLVDNDNSKNALPDHVLYRLLNDTPNGRTSAARFFTYLQQRADLQGNGYAYIQFGNNGKIQALHELLSERVTILQADNAWGYAYQVADFAVRGSTQIVPPELMFHIRGMYTQDNIIGLSPITYARISISLGLSTELFGERLFRNGTMMSGFIKFPGEVDPKEQESIQQDFVSKYSGYNNFHTPAMFTSGAEWVPMGVSNEDSQFLQTRLFQAIEIARWFNVPPHKLRDLSHATLSNLEEQNIQFVQETVVPICKEFEDEIKLKLLTPAERLTVRPEFDESGLMRGKATERINSLQAQYYMGAITTNELRAELGRPPIENGDNFIIQKNLNVYDSTAPKPDGKLQDTQGNDVAPIRSWLADGIGRLVQRDVDRLTKALAKADDAETEIRQHYEKSEYVQTTLAPVIQAGHLSADLPAQYASQQRGNLLGLLREQGLDAVKQRLQEWTHSRRDELTNILWGNHNAKTI